MNYNYLPKKKENNSQFVNNKETFNKRIFDRNSLNTQIMNQTNIAPKYMSENYNINRKNAQSIFNKRIIPEISKKPIVDFVNFRDNQINKQAKNRRKKYTNINQIERETDFLKNSKKANSGIFFRDSLLNNLSKNPYSNNSNNKNIPTAIDFSKSNLSFFINKQNK